MRVRSFNKAAFLFFLVALFYAAAPEGRATILPRVGRGPVPPNQIAWDKVPQESTACLKCHVSKGITGSAIRDPLNASHTCIWTAWSASIPGCAVSSRSRASWPCRRLNRRIAKSLPDDTAAHSMAYHGARRTFWIPPAFLPPPAPSHTATESPRKMLLL